VHESTDLAFSSDEVLHSVGFDNEAAQAKTLEPLNKSQVSIEQRIQPRYQTCQIAAAHQKQDPLKFLPELQLIRTSLKVFTLLSAIITASENNLMNIATCVEQ
jgi:hypothetical protein